MSHTQNPQQAPQRKELSWMETIGSTIAATFGVQSSRNRIRDFTHGEIRKFVLVAIGMTVALTAGLLGIVEMVI